VPTPDLVVRTARAEELTEVGDLTVAAYTSGDHLDPADPSVEERREAARRAGAGDVLVAERAGRVVGATSLVRGGSWLAELAVDDEWEIRMLGVDPAVRRAGVARALVLECLGRAGSAAAPALLLSTRPGNARAIALYEGLGFTRVPDRDLEPERGFVLIAYAKSL